MRVHWLQHVPFEGLGSIADWMEQRGHELTCTRVWESTDFPDIYDVDWLIVMGGPMGVYDEAEYPWLIREKAYIKEIIPEGILGKRRPVLGICLGAQLIADVLRTHVHRNDVPEIGWGAVKADPTVKTFSALTGLAGEFDAFHWHFDSFGIPPEATHIFSSDDCKNQGFVYDERVVGLQFHLETRREDAERLIEHGGDDLAAADIDKSTAKAWLEDEQRFDAMNTRMAKLLEGLERVAAAEA